MLFGCCASAPDRIAGASAAGADFIEVGLSWLMSLDDDEFRSWSGLVADAGVPARAANAFMPAEIKVTGPAVDQARVDSYVATAGRRLHSIGATVAVFGSGGARQVPDGFDHDVARRQFGEFLETAAQALEPYGVALAVEPLRSAESNIVNTVADGDRLVRESAPSARLLADCFHMEAEGESLEVCAATGDRLVHTHVSGLDRRGPTDDDEYARAFVQRLSTLGYPGGVSCECNWGDFATEVGPTLERLRRWAE